MVANYSAAAIPLDTIWTDIDYMQGFRDFTLDPVRFPPDKFRVGGCVASSTQEWMWSLLQMVLSRCFMVAMDAYRIKTKQGDGN